MFSGEVNTGEKYLYETYGKLLIYLVRVTLKMLKCAKQYLLI